MAKDIKFKLIVDGKEAEYSVEKLGKLLESLGYKGFRSFSKFGSETKKVEKYLEGVRRTLGRLQRTLVAIAGVWVAREVIRGFEGLAKEERPTATTRATQGWVQRKPEATYCRGLVGIWSRPNEDAPRGRTWDRL